MITKLIKRIKLKWLLWKARKFAAKLWVDTPIWGDYLGYKKEDDNRDLQ